MKDFNPLIFLAGLAFGAALTFLTNTMLKDYNNSLIASAQMTQLVEIKRQCDSKFPLLLDNTFYECKYLRKFK